MELDNNYLTTCIYTMRFNIYIYIYMIGLFQMESLIIIVNHINIYIYIYMMGLFQMESLIIIVNQLIPFEINPSLRLTYLS